METLQPKHVCPYLPYKVMAYHKEQESKIDRIVGIYYNTLDFENWSPINPNIKNYKLVLRPLADLTKEIEVNGEKFVPYVELLRECNFDVDNMPKKEIERYKPTDMEIEMIQSRMYLEIVKLFEWHFDVFGLIEKGLAIDINTL